jgi:hypothetical protein
MARGRFCERGIMLNQNLYKIFSSQNLSDLILVGYSDTIKGFKNFNAVMNSVFLIFGEMIIRVESYEQYSKVKLSITDENAYSESCTRAEDDELMLFSALDLYTLHETYNIGITNINLFYDKHCDIENGIYRAVGINLVKNAGYLFFDPTHLSGILIGSSNLEKYWFENWEFWQSNNKTLGDITQKTIQFENS